MNTLYDIFTGISEGGLSINTNIFETNILNLIVFVGAVFVYGSKFLSETLSNRQERIVSSLQEAETRLQQAESRLDEARKQLDQIGMIVDSITTEAQTAGTTLQTSILMQGKKDIERLTANAKVTIGNTEVQVKRQILQQITALTMQRVSTQFKEVLNFDVQARIIDRGIAELGA